MYALSYRPDIDGLRALAVLAVLGFHFFPAYIPGGFVGVDVFFVISGHLISGLILRDLENSTYSHAKFIGQRIIFVGMVPVWREKLPRLLLKTQLSGSPPPVPARLKDGFDENAWHLDAKLESMARTLDVEFVSPLGVFCNDEGCLAREGNRLDSLTSWDQAHLTTAGSSLLARHILALLDRD